MNSTLVSFKFENPVMKKLDDHIDLTKIRLRKKGIKFSKRDIIQFMLIEQGIPAFDNAAFEAWLKSKEVKEEKIK